MAYGFRARDGAGNIVVEYTDRLTRVLGWVDTGTSNGSIYIGDADGVPFYALAGTTGIGTDVCFPTISLSGRTLSWTFNTGFASSFKSVKVVYGVHA